MSERLRALAIDLAALAVLLSALLPGGRILAIRDLADFNLPHKLFTVAELHAHRLPLWNPGNFCGYPHLANLQSGVLYPPNALLALLPFAPAFNLTVALHFLLAAAGARRLAAALGAPAPAARVAGIGYAFSPYLVSMIDLLPPLYGAAWLPWAMLAGLRLGERPRPRGVVGLAIVLALTFLAGEPLYFAIAAALAGAAALGEATQRRRAALASGAAIALSLLLAAPALLPFLELASLSERAGAGLTAEQALRDSLPWRGLTALVVPPPADAGEMSVSGGQAYIRRPYLGLALVLLAGLGVRAPVDRRTWTLLLLAGLGVLLSLGAHGGLYPLLYDLGFRQSRYPMKFLVLTLLAVALLAARGAARLPARSLRLATALVALDLVVAARPLVAVADAAMLLAPGGSGAAIAATGAAAAPGCAWPRVYSSGFSGEVLAWVHPTGRHDAAAIARKKALLLGNTNLYAGLAAVGGADSVEVRWTGELLDAIAAGPAARPLLDLTGAGWFVGLHDLAPLGFQPAFASGAVRIHRNPAALPRAFLVGRASDRSVFVPGFDPRREASIAVPPGDLAGDACHEGSAEVVACAPDRLAVRTRAGGGCLLVVTDTWYPGWSAALDGASAPILRADHAFRAVLVPAGEHTVEMVYRPGSFRLGLGLAAAGALIAALAAWRRSPIAG